MQKKCAFFIVLLALLAILTPFSAAHAQAMLTNDVDVTSDANPCDPQNPGASVTTTPKIDLINNAFVGNLVNTVPDPTIGGFSSSTNPIDQAFQTVAAQIGQMRSKDIKAAWAGYNKIDYALNYCVVRVINTYQMLISSMGINPIIGALISIATRMVLNIINSVCSQVLSDINTLASSLSALTRICIPLPPFGLKLGGLHIKVPTCTGGMAIPLIGFNNNPNAIHPFSPQNPIPAGQQLFTLPGITPAGQ